MGTRVGRMKSGKAMTVAIATSIAAGPIVAAFWFAAGALQFGFVTGPGPSASTWVAHTAVVLPPAVAVFAIVLRMMTHRCTRRSMRWAPAVVSSTIALGLVHAAITIISLGSRGEDPLTFLAAVTAALLVYTSSIRSWSSHR